MTRNALLRTNPNPAVMLTVLLYVCVQGAQREAVLRYGAVPEQHLGHFRGEQEQAGESCIHLQTARQSGQER